MMAVERTGKMVLRRLLQRRTKIACTLGPASDSAATIEQLIKAGMNIARLNLAHGNYEGHARYIHTVRRLAQSLAIPVALLLDLPGPKYRTGKLKDAPVNLKRGDEIILTTKPIEGEGKVVPVNSPNLVNDVKVEDTILLDDGAIQLKVLQVQDTEIKCKVMVGGMLAENRGLVVPGRNISVPFFTSTLREHLLFAIEQQVDYIALSFVGDADDVSGVRAILEEKNGGKPIIAKIERGSAVEKFDYILKVSDGIMVARGDLGVDIPLAKVPLVQKQIIRKCNRAGKPVITATQMLESMVNAPSPTRAEVSDVANAIFDGTDVIMLSAETSIGKFPVEAVKMMAKVAQEAESKLNYEQMLAERGQWLARETNEVIGHSACHIAQTLEAVAIVAFTQSGSTAGRVSKYRPRVPILAITPDKTVARKLMVYWGVYPFQIPDAAHLEGLFSTAARVCKEIGLAKAGDLIVITGGIPLGVAGSTNLLKVEKIT